MIQPDTTRGRWPLERIAEVYPGFRSKIRFYEFAEHVSYRYTTTIKCTKFTTFSVQVQTLYKMFVPVRKTF